MSNSGQLAPQETPTLPLGIGAAEHWRQSPHQVLSRLVANRESGRLVAVNPWDEFVHWQVYIGNGRVHFANSRRGHYSRLQYLLGRYLDHTPLKLPLQIEDDYAYIYELWEKKIFTTEQIHLILKQCTQEALVQVLALESTDCFFEDRVHLKNIFLNLDLEQSFSSLENKVKYWSQLQRYVHSPFQRPLAQDRDSLNAYLQERLQKDPYWIQCFNASLENLLSLYEIAYRTEISTLELALWLKPLIKSGSLQMLPYDSQASQPDRRPLVALLNNKPGIQRMVRFTLEAEGYRVLVIDDVFRALAILLSKRPSLVLIEDEMMDVGGCSIVELFQQAPELANIPLIILCKEGGLIEKIKLKLMGIAGLLTYPFLPRELIALVKNWVPLGAGLGNPLGDSPPNF
ncbi:MAG: response regulator [Cyanobacteriota bacterium]|nr:response regulator [Cyanobacteriota bacterium]